MTTLPNTLAGASSQLPDAPDVDTATSIVQPTPWPETVTKTRVNPETLMTVLLAFWIVLAAMIIGFTTTVSY